MFVLQKFIGSLIEFPGCCITILILLRILLRKKILKKTKRNLVLGIVVFYTITTPFFARFLIMPLERIDITPAEIALKKNSDWNNGIIVVMGDSIKTPIPFLPGIRSDFEPGSRTLMRLDMAYRLNRKTGMPIIVSGGNYDFSEGISAATIMKDTLVLWGISSEIVVEEINARTSKENASYAIQLIPNKVERIFLVTSAFHMKRSIFAFKRAMKKVLRHFIIIPIPCDYSYSENVTIYDFIPNGISLVTFGVAIHEYIGFLFYFVTA